MAQPLTARPAACSGFTLVELAIVVAIVAVLLGSLLVTVSGQIEVRRVAETRETLQRIHDSLIGFAAANGRLPCPARNASNGQESPAGGGACNGLEPPIPAPAGNVVHGFVPGVTLGITPTDTQGFVIDGWGNRMRYALFRGSISAQVNVFSTAGQTKNVGMSAIAGANLLNVCAGMSALGTTCSGSVTLTNRAPAVFYSLGRNGSGAPAGNDEAENYITAIEADQVFVARDLAEGGGGGGPFDDMVSWLSLNILFNRMIVAGQLP